MSRYIQASSSPFQRDRLRSATREMCSLSGWNNPHAVTLTMKQARRVLLPSGVGGLAPDTLIHLDHDRCRRNFQHFANVLNRRVYGNASWRFGKRVRVIPVIEHDEVHRWH